MNGHVIDIAGRRFGRLSCISRHGTGKKQKEMMWLCKCDCGKEIITRGSSLRNGSSKSCGCARIEAVKHNTTHALSKDENGNKSRLYGIWLNMKTRCLNPNTPKFKNHGGRGISIFDGWKMDYVEFHNWAMSHGYKDTLTLERKDNDGNYTPSNCTWATYHEQNINTRNNHVISFHGITQPLIEWSRTLGINYKTLGNRLTQYHWTVEKAFTIPVGKRRRKLIENM